MLGPQCVCLLLFLGLFSIATAQWDFVDFMHDFRLKEDIEAGIELYTLRATYGGSPQGVLYGIEPEDDQIPPWATSDNNFQVNKTTGVVTTRNMQVDFETQQKLTVFFVAYLESDENTYVIKKPVLRLQDANDNRPEFQNTTMSVDVSEGALIPQGGLELLTNIYVTDVDLTLTSGLFVLNVTCNETNVGEADKGVCSKFEFRPGDGFSMTSGSWRGSLWLVDQLNYEEKSLWKVPIQAFDGTNRASEDITVLVIDEHDTPPVIVTTRPNFEVDEQGPLNEVIATIKAVDGDRSMDRDLYYTFLSIDDPSEYDYRNIFSIGARSGDITNKMTLDLETPPFDHGLHNNWRIRIQVCEILDDTDPSSPVVSNSSIDCNTKLFRIGINDLNDNAPDFTNFDLINSPPRTYVYNVSEGAKKGFFLLPSMKLADPDSPPFSKFDVFIVGPPIDEFGLEIGTDSATLVVEDPDKIDFESNKQQYIFQVKAEDQGNASLANFATVIINVVNENDETPRFLTTDFTYLIPENIGFDEIIGIISATDDDLGDFGEGLLYSLEMNEKFQIDEISGAITPSRQCLADGGDIGIDPCLDYDAGPKEYKGYVNVVDYERKQGYRTQSHPITITLYDVNDNRPEVFNKSTFIVEGNTVPGGQGGLIVEATDIDVQNERPLTFILDDSLWQIDSVTGSITARVPVDLLIHPPRFNLIVDVTDGKHTVQAYVDITVIDTNNHDPYFLQDRYRISIPESTPGDTFIIGFEARDNDGNDTDFGRIEYSIGTGDGAFTIPNPDVGELFTIQNVAFDREVKDFYSITVLAIDQGSPQRTGIVIVEVVITDSNNKAPYVDPFTQSTTIPENTPPGTIIYRITAKDPDENFKLNYRFVEPFRAISGEGQFITSDTLDFTSLFGVNLTTGDVKVLGELRASRTSIVSYGVEVTDVNAVNQTGRGTLTIVILEVNDRRPYFKKPPTEPIQIEEETRDTTFVARMLCEDPDGQVQSYQIVEQEEEYFGISAQTGQVNLIRRVDVDDLTKPTKTNFNVTCGDDGSPQLFSEPYTVYVEFININDNIPTFDFGGQEEKFRFQQIYEHPASGTFIIDLNATDADRHDENGFDVIFYTIDDDRFAVDETTGVVTLTDQAFVTMDREVKDNIKLKVTACDTPNDPSVRLCQPIDIFVELLDINDNEPEFAPKRYVAQVFEIMGPNNLVLTVFATDRDIGTNAELAFFKEEGSGDPEGLFSVATSSDSARTSGEISTAKNLFGKVGTYTFNIRATDQKGQGLSGYAEVTIIVLKSPNGPPYFVRPPTDNQTITVLEEQYSGMIVTQVEARDNDTGRNGEVEYRFLYRGEKTSQTPEFKINSVTGVIKAKEILDRERQDTYFLLVVASDLGDTPLEAKRFISIKVLDVNDHDPYFGQSLVEFSVIENAPKDTYIGQVNAEDPDENPQIFYDIIGGNEDGIFYLDQTSGVITLAKPLDSETKSIYYMDIKASNERPDYIVIRRRQKRATGSDIIQVKVTVGDVNDEAPQFSQDSYYGCISTKSSFDKHILKVKAVDPDAVGSGRIRYNLTGIIPEVAGEAPFSIEPQYGVVTNNVLMRNHIGTTFRLTVQARDAEDLAVAETSTVEAMVFVTEPSNEVKLRITQNAGEVRLYQSQIQKIIALAPEIDYLCINDIQNHMYDKSGSVSKLWADVYVAAVTEDQNGAFVVKSGTELKNIIDRDRYGSREKDFSLLYIDDVQVATDEQTTIEESALLIVMIIVAVLIFLLIVFCILAFLCIRMAKKEKKRLIVQKSHAAQYGVEPVVVPPVYDNMAMQHDEGLVVEPGAMYAVVQKKSSTLEPPPDVEPAQEAVFIPEPEPELEVAPAQIIMDEEDVDEPRIEVEIDPEDNVVPQPTYVIETEVM